MFHNVPLGVHIQSICSNFAILHAQMDMQTASGHCPPHGRMGIAGPAANNSSEKVNRIITSCSCKICMFNRISSCWYVFPENNILCQMDDMHIFGEKQTFLFIFIDEKTHYKTKVYTIKQICSFNKIWTLILTFIKFILLIQFKFSLRS